MVLVTTNHNTTLLKMNKIAQTKLNLFDGNNGYTGYGILGLENGGAGNAPSIFSTFISSTIGIITVVGIIWFLFNFITGTVAIITSGGDKGALESAKKKITNGFIGLVATFLGLLIMNLFAYIAGIGNILNITEIIKNLTIK